MRFATLVKKFVSEETKHPPKTQSRPDLTLLNEICDFGRTLCIRRKKAPTRSSIKRPESEWEFDAQLKTASKEFDINVMINVYNYMWSTSKSLQQTNNRIFHKILAKAQKSKKFCTYVTVASSRYSSLSLLGTRKNSRTNEVNHGLAIRSMRSNCCKGVAKILYSLRASA